MQVLLVVVLAPIDQHLANSEEILKLLKRRQAFRALRHLRTQETLDSQFCIPFGPVGSVAALARLRSILLRLQNQ